jgi:hypothetical protein
MFRNARNAPSRLRITKTGRPAMSRASVSPGAGSCAAKPISIHSRAKMRFCSRR